MNIIRGPWCDSELVSERRLVRLFMEIWPTLAAMPDAILIARLQQYGLDQPKLLALSRILERQKKRRQQMRRQA
jgi:hypothetical protein